MRTTLNPARIVQLHAEGQAEAARSPFVNPHTAARAEQILTNRGEEWAQSVLLRTFTRRSVARPSLPWFEKGELEILVLAERAEWEQLDQTVFGAPDQVTSTPEPRKVPAMDIDMAKLAEIEAKLTNDELTDEQLVADLHAAGLPEVARVLGNAFGEPSA